MLNVYSNVYLPLEVDNYNCYIHQTKYNELQDIYNSKKIFARIKKNDTYWICSVGAPIGEEENSIYVPYWMLEQIDCVGDGEMLDIEFIPSEIFDPTTRIVLQAHMSGFETENIQEVLSNELTKLGILQKNTTIHIHNYELNMDIAYNVVDLEPASVSICDGDSVVLDFIESVDTITRAPTPYPFVDTITRPPTPTAPIVEEELGAPVLGGIKRNDRFNPWRNKDFKPNLS